jgi:hypothetical protein
MIRYLYQNHLKASFLLLLLLPVLGYAQTYPGKVGVGVDMGWNRPFVDAAKNLRSFTRPDGTAVPKDNKGWPLADAQTVLMDMRPAAEWVGTIDDPEAFRQDVSGTYKCSFTGQGDINKIEGPFTLGPKSYNATTNTTSFDLTVDPPGPHHGLVVITFTNTRRTPGSALNSGFTNLKAIKPGYDAATTQLFTNAFLNALKSGRFSTIRTMGFTHTNNSNPFFPGVTEWANRKQVDDATYEDDNIGHENGAPWEVIVDLANAADVDLWINVPVAATDDYVTQLANLVKNRLEPDRKLYVEYSNEVWNWGFQQSVWNNEKAKTLGLNHIKNYAKRTVEIAQIFRTAFGATSLNDKVRVINAWQIGWNPPDAMYEEQMQYINDTFGPPRNFIYGLGVAPYHNCGNACETGTVTQILDAMVASSDASLVDRKKIVAVASKWQIPGGMVAYEGGSDTGGGSATNIANKITAERAPRMKDIMVHDLRDNWFPHGGGLFMYLEVTSNYSRYGSWGLTDDVNNPDRNYKYAAVREIVGTGTTTVPAAPTGLTATAGNGTVTLSWSPASGATGYRVKRSTTSGTSYTLIASPGVTSYSDNTVTNGTTYYYVVSAVNGVGEGANSAQASATPSAASTVTVTREVWSNVTGTAVSAIPVTTTPTSTGQLSSLEGPLDAGDNYGARIRAYVKPTTTGSYTFYISGDDDCELWLSTDANPANKVRIASVTGWTGSREWTKYTTQTSTARSLTANTNYYVEVLHKEATGGDNVAVGWTGPGIGTISVIGAANLAPYSVQPPPAPTNLAATAGNATVGLSWTAVAGATSYTIKRHTGGNFNNLATGVTTTTYQDNTAANGTTYFYAVTAVNANGESNVSNTASATPTAGTPTATVTREYWANVPGTAVSAIPVTTTPTSTGQLSSLEGPLNAADNYGARIRAYVKPTTTGSYIFYLSGDDDCELWLSTDANPANKVRIAHVTGGWTNSREWNKYTTQASTARSLTANTNYYVEVLHKEGGGGDNLAVGWTGPGISAITVIGAANLAPFTPGTGGGTLLASDNFGAAAGALHNVATGTGWGAAWQVQNNDVSVPGYNVASTTALTYSTLSTSGGYAIGGDSYQTSGRALNVSATGPFSTYLTGDNIGASGKTLWVSLLLRKDAANDEEVSVQLHAGTTVSFPNPALVSVGYFGAASNNGTTRYWSLRVGGTVTRSNVAITTGQTALLVLKLDFAATSTAALFVNPASLGGTAPATASASATSTTSLAFKSLAFYGGSGFSGGGLDELRFGDAYAAVTPTGGARTGVETPGTADLKVFPNPVTGGSLHVKVYAREAGTAVVSLAGTGGSRTLTKEYALRQGQNLLNVSTGTMPSGLYVLSVQQGSVRTVKKVVVQ